MIRYVCAYRSYNIFIFYIRYVNEFRSARLDKKQIKV